MDISSVNTDVFKVDESTSLQTRLTLEISRFLVTSLNLPFKFQIPPPNVRGQEVLRDSSEVGEIARYDVAPLRKYPRRTSLVPSTFFIFHPIFRTPPNACATRPELHGLRYGAEIAGRRANEAQTSQGQRPANQRPPSSTSSPNSLSK